MTILTTTDKLEAILEKLMGQDRVEIVYPTEPDTDKLREVLDQITALHEKKLEVNSVIARWRDAGLLTEIPETKLFDQGTWRSVSRSCGTAMCTAGWVAELDDRVDWMVTDQTGDEYELGVIVPKLGYYLPYEASQMHIEHYARGSLGLSEDQCILLFSGNNTYENVKRIIESICEDPRYGTKEHCQKVCAEEDRLETAVAITQGEERSKADSDLVALRKNFSEILYTFSDHDYPDYESNY